MTTSAPTPRDEQDEQDPFLSRKRGGTELYLIRHGDAVPEAHEVRAGDYDAQHLSGLGRQQAQALADRLRAVAFDAIATSPLERVRATAAPLAQALGAEPHVVDGLREVRLGALGPSLPDGATAQEMADHMRSRLEEIARRATAAGSWDGVPGSEPSAAFRARVVAAHDTLAAAHPGARIACFEHAGTINTYIAAVLGLERDFFFPCANTSISIVRVKGQRRVLLALNDVCHLREAGLLKVPE